MLNQAVRVMFYRPGDWVKGDAPDPFSMRYDHNTGVSYIYNREPIMGYTRHFIVFPTGFSDPGLETHISVDADKATINGFSLFLQKRADAAKDAALANIREIGHKEK